MQIERKIEYYQSNICRQREKWIEREKKGKRESFIQKYFFTNETLNSSL